MNIQDSKSPNYRLIKNFLNEFESQTIFNDISNQTEENWELDFNKNYPKEEDVDSNMWAAIKDWKGMSMNLLEPQPSLTHNVYANILNKSKILMEQRFKKNLEVEQYLLNRWRVGRKQEAHIDYFLDHEDNDIESLHKNNIVDEYIESFKQTFKTKNFSTLIYLNEDYEGGELYFPQYDDLTIHPEELSFIGFKGDTHHLHGVKEVTSGIRYTLSIFWREV
jgi:hypothetical protein